MLDEFLFHLVLCGEFHALYILAFGDPRLQIDRVLPEDIGHHDLGGAEGGELLLHQIKAAPCLRVAGQISGQIILDLNPVFREDGKDQSNDVDKEKEHPFINDKGCDLQHDI